MIKKFTQVVFRRKARKNKSSVNSLLKVAIYYNKMYYEIYLHFYFYLKIDVKTTYFYIHVAFLLQLASMVDLGRKVYKAHN